MPFKLCIVVFKNCFVSGSVTDFTLTLGMRNDTFIKNAKNKDLDGQNALFLFEMRNLYFLQKDPLGSPNDMEWL